MTMAPATSISAGVVQSVKGYWDSAFKAGPATGYSTPGFSNAFRVSLVNKGTEPLDSGVVVTKLPRPGDSNVLSSSGRNPSVSTFPVYLQSTPVVPAGLSGVVVSYSTVTNACLTELNYSPAGCVSPAWSTTAPGNLATVTAIKVAFGSNVLNPGISWDVDMNVTTPVSGANEPDFAVVNPLVNSPSTDELARASSAYVARVQQTQTMLTAAEGPAVTLQMPGQYGPAGAPPVPADLTTTGTGTVQQTVGVTIPFNGSATLVNALGQPVSTLTKAGQGTYSYSAGALTFQPEPGFSGYADPVLYRVTNVFGQSGFATYTPRVLLPGAPAAVPVGISIPQSSGGGAVSIAIPPGGSAALVDSTGTEVSTVTVTGEGTYTVDSVNQRIAFVPDPSFTGTATAQPYRVIDSYGQRANSTVTFSVVPPTNPQPQVSSGFNRAATSQAQPVQSVVVSVPNGTTMQMRSPSGQSVASLVIPNQGTYTFNAQTGTINFAPVFGYAGTPTPATIAYIDSYGQVGTSSYTPVVLAPPLATVSTVAGPGGIGTAPQTITAPSPPPQGSTRLVGPSGPVSTLSVPGEGTYVIDPATGSVTFTPELGFAGTSTPVSYVVTDVYGQAVTSTLSTSVTAPPPPAVSAGFTSGIGTAVQRLVVSAPVGGSVALVDTTNQPVSRMVVPGQGVFQVVGSTIEFTPEDGFVGIAVVPIGVIDAYGQLVTTTLTSTVLAVPLAASMLGVTGIDLSRTSVLALVLALLGGWMFFRGRRTSARTQFSSLPRLEA